MTEEIKLPGSEEAITVERMTQEPELDTKNPDAQTERPGLRLADDHTRPGR